MKIAVVLKEVPDLVEGLEIDPGGKTLDATAVRYVLSEADDHALEQALLLKERYQARVEVFCLALGEAEEALWTALAKGADRAVLVQTEGEGVLDNHGAARLFSALLREGSYDLILTGVRAIDDVDGSLGGLLAGYLDRPYAGLIRSAALAPGRHGVLVQKEYPGGAAAELELRPPAVLGILSAEQPPRYVPVSRLRQIRKTGKLERFDAIPPGGPRLEVESLFQPEEGRGATMLSGTPAELARQLAGVIAGAGLGR